MITRRGFLAGVLAALLAPRRVAAAALERRQAIYTARVGLLYGVLRFEITGTIEESIDREAARYDVRLHGQGSGIENRLESRGTLRRDRWTPDHVRSRFVVHGRESWVDVTFDHERRQIAYKSRSETFVLRRVRQVDDLVAVPEGVVVDDVISASLNYAEGRWPPGPDGALVTHVVRRRRGRREASDEVEAAYRAELVPFELRVGPDPAPGRTSAVFDLTRFSSWALEGEPARIAFGRDRRPEELAATLMLGTSLAVRVAS
jgi:hypothetical protein